MVLEEETPGIEGSNCVSDPDDLDDEVVDLVVDFEEGVVCRLDVVDDRGDEDGVLLVVCPGMSGSSCVMAAAPAAGSVETASPSTPSSEYVTAD